MDLSLGLTISRRNSLRLSQDGLVFVAFIKNNLQDNIGESSITLTTGTIADLPNATWGFPINAITVQADTDIGGLLFDAGVPIVRSGAEWYAILNLTHVWIGFHASRGGIVIYIGDMSAKATQIQNYLGRYTSPIDQAVNPDDSLMFNPDDSPAYNPA